MTMNIDRALLQAGSRVLCAVSGGADSMCLLELLRSRGDWKLFAAHYEHGLRGEESLRDAAFVQDWCAKKGIPCTVEHGDVAAYAREHGLGIEEAARTLRYAFLERTADTLGCDLIATAHNAEDNAETMLLNLCRGAGAAGLSGIPPQRGRIIRPLLGCTRQEIEAFLRENQVPYIEDSSNRGDAYARNRLRHRAIPALREENPRFAENMGRTAFLLRQDEEFLDSLAEAFLAESFDGESLPLDALLKLHRAVSSRVIRLLCPNSLSLSHVEAALCFCQGEGLGYLDLPGLRLRREQGRLYVNTQECVCQPDRALIPGTCLELPEAGLRLRISEEIFTGEIYDLFKTSLFKCENICGRLYCTGRRPGDRLHPQGRNCGKSLRSLFREAGMTQRQRDSVPVLRDEKGVLAVLGLAVDERARPAPGDRILRIETEKIEETNL